MKKWTVYCTTNLVNGRRYIGVHKTADPEDDYLGSGKLIQYAIQKHGRENFRKEVLLVTEDKAEAFALEAKLVTKDALESGELYNLKEGGEGGWDFCNKMLTPSQKKGYAALGGKLTGPQNGKIFRRRGIEASARARKQGLIKGPFSGYSHSEDTKKKMSESKKVTSAGERNSQFGTIWITDGALSRKIKKQTLIPEGWRRGRS